MWESVIMKSWHVSCIFNCLRGECTTVSSHSCKQKCTRTYTFTHRSVGVTYKQLSPWHGTSRGAFHTCLHSNNWTTLVGYTSRDISWLAAAWYFFSFFFIYFCMSCGGSQAWTCDSSTVGWAPRAAKLSVWCLNYSAHTSALVDLQLISTSVLVAGHSWVHGETEGL